MAHLIKVSRRSPIISNTAPPGDEPKVACSAGPRPARMKARNASEHFPERESELMNFAILESLFGVIALFTFVLAARSEVNDDRKVARSTRAGFAKVTKQEQRAPEFEIQRGLPWSR